MQMISGPGRDFYAIITIAQRDVLRFLRDPSRTVATLILPVLFVGLVGASFQGSFRASLGYNLMVVIFTGIFAQTLFQSTASGIVWLIEDREYNFSQAIFTPLQNVAWYLTVLSKIVPLTDGVDLVRNAYYAGRPEYSLIIIANPMVNIVIIAGLFLVFVFIGTALFVNGERNR